MEDREGEEEDDDDDDVDSEDEADEKGAGKSFAQLNGTYVHKDVHIYMLTYVYGWSFNETWEL
jgi:hypothetical protein